jgi:hypothetical protein
MDTVKIPLADKHTGMRVDASGALASARKGSAVLRRMMLEHLQETARRFYAGDLAVVDEFLQLYCLGVEERKQAVERNAKMEAAS